MKCTYLFPPLILIYKFVQSTFQAPLWFITNYLITDSIHSSVILFENQPLPVFIYLFHLFYLFICNFFLTLPNLNALFLAYPDYWSLLVAARQIFTTVIYNLLNILYETYLVKDMRRGNIIEEIVCDWRKWERFMSSPVP